MPVFEALYHIQPSRLSSALLFKSGEKAVICSSIISFLDWNLFSSLLKQPHYVAQVILELVILSDEIAEDCPHN